MSKKIVTRYYEPLTPKEREEIQELLKPVVEEKERWEIANQLRVQIIKSTYESLRSAAVDHPAAYERISDELNEKLQTVCNEWYDQYAPRLSSDIRPEHIRVSVSKDGLYVLGYTDVLKDILTKADFELKTFAWIWPEDEWEFIRQANEFLEKAAVEE